MKRYRQAVKDADYVYVSAVVPREHVKELDRLAAQHGRSRSHEIRAAINARLKAS